MIINLKTKTKAISDVIAVAVVKALDNLGSLL